MCLTTYENVINDHAFFLSTQWHAIVVDEAQRIKNNNSILYQNIAQLQSRFRILLSGAPIQNTLDELYAMLSMLMPNVFTSQEEFVSRYSALSTRTRAARDVQVSTARRLQSVMKPFFLRRVKDDVLTDLPPKTSYIIYADLTDKQRDLYRGILSKTLSREQVNASFNNIVIQLRKCALHPYLFDGVEPEPFVEGDHLYNVSGKMAILDALLSDLQSKNKRVLLFTQITRMLDILQDYCTYRGYSYERLDGSVRGEERYEALSRFSSEEAFVFLLSTRAGGVGLNLVAADTVIFLDSDWNPTVDMQVMQCVCIVMIRLRIACTALVRRTLLQLFG